MLQELDKESDMVLKLDEFKNLEQLENLFDSWRDIKNFQEILKK